MQLSLMFHSVVFSLNINKFVVAVFRKCKMCFDKVDFIAQRRTSIGARISFEVSLFISLSPSDL